MSYSRVCGHVSAYRWKTTDSFDTSVQKDRLGAAYVDGVSITRGYPRQHIWSYGKLHHVRVTLWLLDIVNCLFLVRTISVKLFPEVLIQRVDALS